MRCSRTTAWTLRTEYVLPSTKTVMKLVRTLDKEAHEGQPSLKTFQSLVGSLLWIARCTRPDISFAVHRATRQTHKPTIRDYKAAKKIARYLKMTKTLKLCINSSSALTDPVKLESWSDAGFAVDKANRKSVSGCVVTMDGAVVS